MEPWIGFDLDGTLACYDGWKGEDNIGEPILPMIEKVKEYLNSGMKCKIFTAREVNAISEPAIHDWLQKAGLPKLEITNKKDYGMLLFYDDRAIAVESDTGKILGGMEIIR